MTMVMSWNPRARTIRGKTTNRLTTSATAVKDLRRKRDFFSLSFYIFCFFGYFIPEMVVPVDELLLIGEVELFPGVSYKVKEGKRLSTVIYWFYLKKK